MSNDEEPAPSAALSENEDDEACSDAEQASYFLKQKICKQEISEINFCHVKVVGFLCINCQLKNFPQRRRQLFFLPPRPPKPVRLTLQ